MRRMHLVGMYTCQNGKKIRGDKAKIDGGKQ